MEIHQAAMSLRTDQEKQLRKHVFVAHAFKRRQCGMGKSFEEPSRPQSKFNFREM